jgi:CHAT domain-containing protein/TolA-binding protein
MDEVKAIDCGYVQDHDLVKSYLGGGFSEEEAEAFEAHYFACDRCWEEVNTANQIRAATTSANSRRDTGVRVRYPPRVARPQWRALALAAAVAVALFGGGLIYLRSQNENGLRALAAAAGEMPFRRVEARLAGPFRHLPLEPVTRGANEASLPLDLRRAALDSQKRAEDHPTAESLHAAGLGHLLVGELDQAIATLEEARKLAPNDPVLLNDLAAAHLARAQQKIRLGASASAIPDFESALEATAAALKEDPDAPEALFNRALVLEANGLRTQAAETWRRYLKKDSDSPWALEAQAHLKALSEETESRVWEKERPRLERAALAGDRSTLHEILSRFQQPARLMAEDRVLPEWADAAMKGDLQDAARSLRLAVGISTALGENGDFLLADSARAIQHARGSSLESLITGHSAYGQAREEYKRGATQDATELFQKARIALVDSPFRSLAVLGLASCAYFKNDLERCSSLLGEIERPPKSDEFRYPSLVAQTRWVRGLVQESRGDLGEAVASYGSALDGFVQLKETGNVAALNVLLAEDLRYLGERKRAWEFRREAILRLGKIGGSTKLPPALGEAAHAALKENHVELALAYGNEQLDVARQLRNQALIAESFHERSRTYLARQDTEAAIKDLQLARLACDRISEVSVRDRMLANISAADGEAAAEKDQVGAINSFSYALEFFRSRQHHFRVADLLLKRGRLYAERQESTLALGDFLAGIDELESERAAVREEDLRISHFETAAALFDEAIGILSRRGDFAGAFDYSERERARSLLDATGKLMTAGPRMSPLTSTLVPPLMPEHVAILEYVLFDDRLLLWIVRRDGVRSVQISVPRARVEQLASRLRDSVLHASTANTAAGSELYSFLIKGADEYLRGAETLVFVPDGALHAVPFAALVDPGGRYLIERYRIGVSPSTTVYLNSLARQRLLDAPSPPRLLAVGNPTIDPKHFAGLPNLAAAGQEAIRVASYYPRSETLTAARATPRRFLELAPGFDVIHFAGHAVVDPDSPALSALILAADPASGDSGALYADRISSRGLGRVELVILAACSTAEGLTLGTEGVLSLARAFLAAGVPAVVASLGPVGDSEANALFEVFHQRLRRGDDAMTALRNAQLTLLRERPERVTSWSAFEVIGGVGNRKGVGDVS